MFTTNQLWNWWMSFGPQFLHPRSRLEYGHMSIQTLQTTWRRYFLAQFDLLSFDQDISNGFCQDNVFFSKSRCIVKSSWASTFDAKSWKSKELGSRSPTFNTKSWRPNEPSFGSPTFNIKSWSPKELGSRSPTFDVESWSPRTIKLWYLAFSAKSWRPRAQRSWSSTFDSESWIRKA